MVEQLALGLCECGCGQPTRTSPMTNTEKGWKKGVPRRFVNGHNARLPKSPEHAANVGRALRGRSRPEWSGERNPAWRGDDAGYDAKHRWINKTHPKTGLCEHCGGESRDYANVSKEYKRDRADWLELCTSCHKRFDGHTREGGFHNGGWDKRRADVA